jgi:hypothetical protein
MGLTGDFAVLDDWAERIGSLGSDSAIRELSADLGAAALKLTDAGFDGQHNPFGNPWARKKFPDGRPVGRGKTGKLRSTYKIKQLSRIGFTIGSLQPYRKFFHGGRKRRGRQPPRLLSPGNTIPPRWAVTFDDVWHRHCLTKLKMR